MRKFQICYAIQILTLNWNRTKCLLEIFCHFKQTLHRSVVTVFHSARPHCLLYDLRGFWFGLQPFGVGGRCVLKLRKSPVQNGVRDSRGQTKQKKGGLSSAHPVFTMEARAGFFSSSGVLKLNQRPRKKRACTPLFSWGAEMRSPCRGSRPTRHGKSPLRVSGSWRPL